MTSLSTTDCSQNARPWVSRPYVSHSQRSIMNCALKWQLHCTAECWSARLNMYLPLNTSLFVSVRYSEAFKSTGGSSILDLIHIYPVTARKFCLLSDGRIAKKRSSAIYVSSWACLCETGPVCTSILPVWDHEIQKGMCWCDSSAWCEEFVFV